MGCDCDKKPELPKADKCGDMTPAVLEVNNPSEVIMFHKVIIPASMGDETEYPALNGLYKNVLMVYAANGHAYLYSSDGVPTYISFDTGGVLTVETLPEPSQATRGFLYVTEAGSMYVTLDGETWITLSTGTNPEFDTLSNRPKYAGVEMTSATDIPSVEQLRADMEALFAAERETRETADDALSTAIGDEAQTRSTADTALQGNIDSLSNDLTAEADNRRNADTALSQSINTIDTAIDKAVMTDLVVDPNASTSVVQLDTTKTNIKTSSTTTDNIPLPVASATQAGVMNAATYQAVTENTSNINALINGAVAITGLPASPTQAELTAAWENASGLTALMNRAGIYDVTNQKVWTYYTNDTTWYAASNTSTVTVNTFTNASEGIIKGSTNIGQVFAENDGTGSVNGWDALKAQADNATSKLATIQQGAEVNVQSDWTEANSSADSYIKNKPANLVQDANYVHTDNNYTNAAVSTVSAADGFLTGGATVNGSGTTVTLNNTAAIVLDDIKLKGDTAQSGSPTPSAPIPVQTVSGRQVITINGSDLEINLGKNIFDKDNPNIINGYFDSTHPQVSSLNYGSSIFIQCEPNTTYSVQRSSTGFYDIAVGYSDTIPAVGVTMSGVVQSGPGAKVTITTGPSAKYLAARVYHNSQDAPNTLEDILATVQVEKGSTATTYAAFINSFGKNLFDPTKVTAGKGLSDTTGAEYDSAQRSIIEYIDVDSSSQYTISRLYPKVIVFYTSSKSVISTLNPNTWNNYTFTTPNNAAYVRISIDNTYTASTPGQIEKGSTATDYAEHIGFNGQLELCKIGDYQDYIYRQNGSWWLHKETGEYTLSASSEFYSAGEFTGHYGYYKTVEDWGISIPNGANIVCLMSHWEQRNFQNGQTNLCFMIGYNTSSEKHTLLLSSDEQASASAFNAWLGTESPKFYYPLKTPTDTEITNTALVNQLESVAGVKAMDGSTVITATGDLPVILDVTAFTKTAKGIAEATTNVKTVNGESILGDGNIAVGDVYEGSVLSPISAVAYVDTANIIDEAVTSDKLKYTVITAGGTNSVPSTSLVDGAKTTNVSWTNNSGKSGFIVGGVWTVFGSGSGNRQMELAIITSGSSNTMANIKTPSIGTGTSTDASTGFALPIGAGETLAVKVRQDSGSAINCTSYIKGIFFPAS